MAYCVRVYDRVEASGYDGLETAEDPILSVHRCGEEDE